MSESHSHARELTPGDLRLPESSLFARLPAIGGVIGLVGLGAAFGLSSADHHRIDFWMSLLTAFMYFLSIALGAMFFVALQHLTRAGWSVVIRRLAENMSMSFPVFLALFVVITLGSGHIWHHWMAEGAMNDPVLKAKEAYLNKPFFFIRAACYFAFWLWASWFMTKRSASQDESGDVSHTRVLQKWSGPIVVGYGLTQTFAAFDWLMSLDPHWFSTIFGVYYFSGSVVAFLAFMNLVIIIMRKGGILGHVVTTEHQHDTGKLMFGFTVFWTYIAFSQFFLIWYANLPEETIWFDHRMHGGWDKVSIALAIGHFVVPFLFLLPRPVKRNDFLLGLGSFWLLVIHFVDIYWLAMPPHYVDGLKITASNVAAFVGVGGLFLAAFGWNLRQRNLVPAKDPRLAESLHFQNNWG